MNELITPIALAFALFVWLRTNAIVEFCSMFLAEWNVGYMGDYEDEPETVRNNLFYSLWLYVKHPCFLTRLISCPLCTSFWTNLLFASGFRMWLFNSFCTLVAFLVLDKLYKHGK